jgi:hypothetical protein
MKYIELGVTTLPPSSVAGIDTAVTPIQFTFGRGDTLLAGARVQKEGRDDKGKKPKE